MERKISAKPILLFFFLFSLLAFMACGEEDCEPCSKEEQQREYDSIISYVRYQVGACETVLNFLHFDDPNYYDYGNVYRCSGNCADWAMATWNALKGYRWNCWNIYKIRARRKWSLSFHNFVYIEPKCGGDRVFLDPFWTGNTFVYDDDFFKSKGFLRGGFFSGAVWARRGTHLAGSPPK